MALASAISAPSAGALTYTARAGKSGKTSGKGAFAAGTGKIGRAKRSLRSVEVTVDQAGVKTTDRVVLYTAKQGKTGSAK